jgi:hypothetical protein
MRYIAFEKENASHLQVLDEITGHGIGFLARKTYH